MGFLSCNGDSAVSICRPKSALKEKPFFKLRIFNYDQLAAATNGFSSRNLLGKGSHGRVYKAVLDGGKLLAAVKRTTITAADNEIEILSRVQHKWMVNLIGYCVDHRRKTKLLVVEYMPNGTLHHHLHSRISNWNRRIKHALQIAIAVHALHSADTPVIHRDIKSSNVLIDGEGNARLADFGLALMISDERVRSTPPAGTLGYLDPSYLVPADLTDKIDVFSFGILLLEIISGREAIDLNYSPSCIVDWAVPLIKRGETTAICDFRIRTRPSPDVIRKLSVVAARCVRSTAKNRPDMSEVVECLKTVRKMSLMWNRIRRGRSEDRSGNDIFVVEEKEERRVPEPPPLRRRNRMMRSRSMGQAKVGPEPNDVVGENTIKTQILVDKERPATMLSKSRSVGVVRGGHRKASR